MGDVVNIELHRQSCENCKWHGVGTCLRPGGWYWDEKFRNCTCFERAKDESPAK